MTKVSNFYNVVCNVGIVSQIDADLPDILNNLKYCAILIETKLNPVTYTPKTHTQLIWATVTNYG